MRGVGQPSGGEGGPPGGGHQDGGLLPLSEAGEELRLETLLYGLLLQSGNDAALAVARHAGGTVENFVAQMNIRAARLGMEHSRFANPSGLNAEGTAPPRGTWPFWPGPV